MLADSQKYNLFITNNGILRILHKRATTMTGKNNNNNRCKLSLHDQREIGREKESRLGSRRHIEFIYRWAAFSWILGKSVDRKQTNGFIYENSLTRSLPVAHPPSPHLTQAIIYFLIIINFLIRYKWFRFETADQFWRIFIVILLYHIFRLYLCITRLKESFLFFDIFFSK